MKELGTNGVWKKEMERGEENKNKEKVRESCSERAERERERESGGEWVIEESQLGRQ